VKLHCKKNATSPFDQLISEGKYCMNSLDISFSYVYAAELVKLNWNDIHLAINHKYLSHQAAIEHARAELENDIFPQAVLDLACLSAEEAIFPHSIHPYIDELVNAEGECEKCNAKDKILYIVLNWVYEHRKDYDDIFEVLTVICDDFGFPETIVNFAWKYTPRKEYRLSTMEENRVKVFESWNQFLNEQQNKWKTL